MEKETPVSITGLTTEEKQWALLSYLVPPLTGLMILFIEDKAKRPFLMYHAVISIALGAIGTVLFCIYPLVWLYCIYLGLKAYRGIKVTVPFLTDLIEQQEWLETDFGES
jgi:uncharacterized membrane protein